MCLSCWIRWQLQHVSASLPITPTPQQVAIHEVSARATCAVCVYSAVLLLCAGRSNTPASPHGEAGWAAWQQRRRHFFVLTAAGKPVYSRHGDEQALAGVCIAGLGCLVRVLCIFVLQGGRYAACGIMLSPCLLVLCAAMASPHVMSFATAS